MNFALYRWWKVIKNILDIVLVIRGNYLTDLIDILNKLAKTFFTGKLTINFHKGNVGKIQLTQTVKNSDLESI